MQGFKPHRSTISNVTTGMRISHRLALWLEVKSDRDALTTRAV